MSKKKHRPERHIKDFAPEAPEVGGDPVNDGAAARILELERQLAECRRKAEDFGIDPSHAALPSSKIPFRIDYYRAAEGSPVKGVIEHLPSRRKRSFEGSGDETLLAFIHSYTQTGDEQAPLADVKTEKRAFTPAKRAVDMPVFDFVYRSDGDQAPSAAVLPDAAWQALKEGAYAADWHITDIESGSVSAATETSSEVAYGDVIPFPNLSLQAGAYRMTLTLAPADKPLAAHYRESRVLVLRALAHRLSV